MPSIKRSSQEPISHASTNNKRRRQSTPNAASRDTRLGQTEDPIQPQVQSVKLPGFRAFIKNIERPFENFDFTTIGPPVNSPTPEQPRKNLVSSANTAPTSSLWTDKKRAFSANDVAPDMDIAIASIEPHTPLPESPKRSTLNRRRAAASLANTPPIYLTDSQQISALHIAFRIVREGHMLVGVPNTAGAPGPQTVDRLANVLMSVAVDAQGRLVNGNFLGAVPWKKLNETIFIDRKTNKRVAAGTKDAVSLLGFAQSVAVDSATGAPIEDAAMPHISLRGWMAQQFVDKRGVFVSKDAAGAVPYPLFIDNLPLNPKTGRFEVAFSASTVSRRLWRELVKNASESRKKT